MTTSHAQNSPVSLAFEKFSETSVPQFVLFSWGYFFHLSCFGNLCMIKFAICIFKARLGGEICLPDVIMHKGYWVFFSYVIRCDYYAKLRITFLDTKQIGTLGTFWWEWVVCLKTLTLFLKVSDQNMWFPKSYITPLNQLACSSLIHSLQ